MTDKIDIILSELDEIKRLIANGEKSPQVKSFSLAGSVTWRLTASDEEAREFSKKKGVERRRAKR